MRNSVASSLTSVSIINNACCALFALVGILHPPPPKLHMMLLVLGGECAVVFMVKSDIYKASE